MSNNCRIRPMGAGDLLQVLEWRNHPEIRRYMLNQHKISLAEHQRWFEHASQDNSRKLLIFEEGDIPLGYINFTGVSRGGISDWGFYLAPDAMKGTGSKLGAAALDFAFQVIELHKVCGQALEINKASISLHRKLGFQEEGLLRDQHQIGDTYHNLYCFGLLHNEWC